MYESSNATNRAIFIVAVLLVAVLAGGAASVLVSVRAGAETTNRPRLLEPCSPKHERILADRLPAKVAPARCPIAGRVIVDHGVGAAPPPPGTGVHAEILTTSGSQELNLVRSEGGILTIASRGDEGAQSGPSDPSQQFFQERAAPERGAPTQRSRRAECSDRAFTDWSWRVASHLRWSFNRRSTPSELSGRGALAAIRAAGNNVFNTDNSCRMGDRVPATLIYEGSASRSVDISNSSNCLSSDGRSVVGFGTLPRTATAETCTYYVLRKGYDRPTSSDTRINKRYATWTTRPNRGSCRSRYDLESTMTHERGHTFGLGHVSERSHPNLTMSSYSNGPCKSINRTLGRGDVRGLSRKY